MSKNKFIEAKNLHPDFSARFANHLLRTLLMCTEADQNISVSPARLQAVMILLANWTSPTIKRTILEQVGNDVITLKEANMLSSKQLLAVSPEEWCREEENCVPMIELQTLLWAQKELEVKEDGLNKVIDYFPIILKSVDFMDSELKSKIDGVVEEATHGLIKELDLQITKETIAIITDILYFKAMWRENFEPENTREQIFYGTKGKEKVPMMKRTDTMEYMEMQTCQMIRLPYMCMSKEDVRFSMRIYLPKQKHTFHDVLLERWNDQFCLYTEEQEVKLTLTRFSVESSINMQGLLQELGLSCIYDSNDLIPDCIKDLKVEQIIQQTKVVVDENGTEAAAVTSVGMMCGCLPFEKPEPVVMTVNRPFIFEITEDETNTVLFIGVINNIE